MVNRLLVQVVLRLGLCSVLFISAPSHASQTCADIFGHDHSHQVKAGLLEPVATAHALVVPQDQIIFESLQRKLSPSFKTLEAKLQFLLKDGGRLSLDSEIHESIKASDGALKAYKKIVPAGLSSLFRRLGVYDAQREVERLETCTLQAAVCAARISLKSAEIQEHIQSLQWSREELKRDEHLIENGIHRLAASPMNAHEKSNLNSSLTRALDEVHVLQESLDFHIGQLTQNLTSAASTLRSTSYTSQLLEKARAAVKQTSPSDLGLNANDLAKRAKEAPLTLEQLSVIESARRLPARRMSLREWSRFITPLKAIQHWRATEQILRFLPEIKSTKSAAQWKERGLIAQRLKGLVYDKRLDPFLLALDVDSQIGGAIYTEIIDRPQDPSSNEIALRFRSNTVHGLAERTYTDADLPVLAELFETHLQKSLYSYDSPFELSLISKIISETSVAYLDQVIASDIWPSRTAYSGEKIIDNRIYRQIVNVRNAMKELLDAEGPQCLKTPVTYQLTEILYGRQKRRRQYL